MDDCCQDKARELVQLRDRHGTLLKAVLTINLAMFFIEAAAGLAAKSTALFAASPDMLGGAFFFPI